MSDAFTVMSQPLVERVRAALTQGDDKAAGQALEELLALFTRLGRREIGTLEEQNAYIVPRHLGLLPPVLQSLGVRPEQLPEPAGRRPAATPSPPLEATRITGDFLAHLRGRDRQDSTERFTVAYRPQDNMVLNGVPQPYAVVDTQDNNLPVSWCEYHDWAETMADMANRMRRAS